MLQQAPQFLLENGQPGTGKEYSEEVQRKKQERSQNFGARTLEEVAASFRPNGRLVIVVSPSPIVTQKRLDDVASSFAQQAEVRFSESVQADQINLYSLSTQNQIVGTWGFRIYRSFPSFGEYLSKVVLTTFIQMGHAYISRQAISLLSTCVIFTLCLGIEYPETIPYFAGLLSVLIGINAGSASVMAGGASAVAAGAMAAAAGNLTGGHIASGIQFDQLWHGVGVTPSITFAVVAAYGGVVQFFTFAAQNHQQLLNVYTVIIGIER